MMTGVPDRAGISAYHVRMTVGWTSFPKQLSSRNPRGNERSHMCMEKWRSSSILGKACRFVDPAIPVHAWKQILYVLVISEVVIDPGSLALAPGPINAEPARW